MTIGRLKRRHHPSTILERPVLLDTRRVNVAHHAAVSIVSLGLCVGSSAVNDETVRLLCRSGRHAIFATRNSKVQPVDRGNRAPGATLKSVGLKIWYHKVMDIKVLRSDHTSRA